MYIAVNLNKSSLTDNTPAYISDRLMLCEAFINSRDLFRMFVTRKEGRREGRKEGRKIFSRKY